MRNILLVLKNNLYRLSKETLILFMMIIVLPIIIYLGIYFSELDGIKGKIAIVGVNYNQEEALKNSIENDDNITLEFLEKSPSKTELIKGIYLAEINFTREEPEVISYGKEEVKKALEANMKGETYTAISNETTVQGKIIGFLTMYLFFGSLMIMDFFLTDRENGAYTRVLIGKVSYYEYIVGQILYAILTITVPSIAFSLLLLKFLAVELSISLGLFALIVLLVGVLLSSFSIAICTIGKDKVTATMGGSAIVLITSLLGGCLINIVDTNKFISAIRNCIPQKRLIDLANNFNNKDLIILLLITVFFILISVFVGKNQCENGDFV